MTKQYLSMNFILNERTDVEELVKEIKEFADEDAIKLLLISKNTEETHAISKLEIELPDDAYMSEDGTTTVLGCDSSRIVCGVTERVRNNSRNNSTQSTTAITSKPLFLNIHKNIAEKAMIDSVTYMLIYAKLLNMNISAVHDTFTDRDAWIDWATHVEKNLYK